MAKSKFKITQFKNPSGAVAWRLSGTLNGKRIRENYKSRPDAVDQRQKYDVDFLNEEPEGRTVWTTLTPEQNRDAVAAMNQLKSNDSKYSLSFAVNFFLENFNPPEDEKRTQEAVDEYIEKRRRDNIRGFLSSLQFKSIYHELEWLKFCHGSKLVSQITEDDYRDYLEKPKNQPKNRRKPPMKLSTKTWNNRRGMLHTFCGYCVEKGYLATNPIAKVPKYKQSSQRATAETLDAETVEKLMHYLESYSVLEDAKRSARYKPGCLVPYFTLALFAGIRPDWKDGEISKIEPKSIDLKTEVIRIDPAISKTNEKRVVYLQPNAKLWLEKYPLDSAPIVPPKNADRMLREIRKKFGIGHDVLRHTFISMTVGAFRSVGDAALQAGNSEAIIRKHYLDLKSVEEADSFWGIVPKGKKLPELEKKDGRYVPIS